MTDPTTARTRMTRDTCAGSASSGSPLAPPRASPCVLDRLGPARPRAHAAAGSIIWMLVPAGRRGRPVVRVRAPTAGGAAPPERVEQREDQPEDAHDHEDRAHRLD